MSRISLPSRYEDLSREYRSRLRPNRPLIELIKRSFASASVTGGIRFIPIFGESGAGKTCATLELATHLPDIVVIRLDREQITSRDSLVTLVQKNLLRANGRKLICVIDQYEEAVATQEDIPTQFVETLSLLDRQELRKAEVCFIWLTTSREFQKRLAEATSRNRRILADEDFEVMGPPKVEWASIIRETFEVHNAEKSLADFQVLDKDLEEIALDERSIGSTIIRVAERLQPYVSAIHDLSQYQVVMLWPVTDGTRISRIQQFRVRTHKPA